MAIWIVRAGRHGELEKKFLEEEKVYLTWDNLNRDLSKINSQKELRNLLAEIYPTNSEKKNITNGSQIWAFSHKIEIGDWVILPSKLKPAIHIAEVVSHYHFDEKAKDPLYHWLNIKWLQTDIPRSNFDQDLLYSIGAFLTICQIHRNDAEKRIRVMKNNSWQTTSEQRAKKVIQTAEDTEVVDTDLEELAKDSIADIIIRKFKGHGMARLVDSILHALGYATYVSPEGPDKGVDILAAKGTLGFDSPKLCVQVKSQETPIDRATLDQLVGTMQNFQAEQGLLVSWSGFKSSVDKERANQFFRVRLWDRDDLIENLLENYNNLDDEIRAELPLKRIWIVAYTEDEND